MYPALGLPDSEVCGYLTSEVSFNRVIRAPPALFQNIRASSGVALCLAISAGMLRVGDLP